VVSTRDKKLMTVIPKYLVEIGNLTFNLMNKEISQNSKLKLRGKVMDLESNLNLIKKNCFHPQDNL
jgi:hypothetical protein